MRERSSTVRAGALVEQVRKGITMLTIFLTIALTLFTVLIVLEISTKDLFISPMETAMTIFVIAAFVSLLMFTFAFLIKKEERIEKNKYLLEQNNNCGLTIYKTDDKIMVDPKNVRSVIGDEFQMYTYVKGYYAGKNGSCKETRN